MPERFNTRFDGAAEWAKLSPKHQAAIGAAALEHVVSWLGYDVAGDEQDTTAARVFEAATAATGDDLQRAFEAALPGFDDHESALPVPSAVGDVCHACGCTQNAACDPPCGRARPGLCTSCAGKPAEAIE